MIFLTKKVLTEIKLSRSGKDRLMKIICIGLNYRQHAIEMVKLPEEPVVFKPDSALLKTISHFLRLSSVTL
jgi:2-keto-4-pentenoate hydratase/2-oxohepta-3-ene-1,7-dioic acid hydratase in catechol pathway